MAKHPVYTEKDAALVRAMGDPIGAESPIPVEVKMVVWVKRQGWEAEHGVNTVAEGYDFEDAIQGWVVSEMQEIGVEQGNWDNVSEVTE